MNFWTLLMIFVCLTFLDKFITAVNITQVQHNFPDQVKADPYSIEKNPLAHWFFEKFGIVGGSFLYWLFSIATMFFSYYMIKYTLSLFTTGAENIALYILVILYFLIIGNNLFFLLKYSKVIS